LYAYFDIDFSKINHYSGNIPSGMNQSISRKTTCTTKQKQRGKKQELEEFIRRFSANASLNKLLLVKK
jgi:ATPase subunit of ABC transporter with duplicated ATPase domains